MSATGAGSIYLNQGSVIHAETIGAKGPYALFSMLLAAHDRISWQAEETPSVLTMNESVHSILFQLAQLEDNGQTSDEELSKLFLNTANRTQEITLKDLSKCCIVLNSADPELQNLEIKLHRGTYLFGQAPDCNVVVSHPTVSRRHCQITVEENCIRLKDLASTNGTYVNQKGISEEILSAGDEVAFGGAIFTLSIRLARNLESEDDRNARMETQQKVGTQKQSQAMHKITGPIRFEDLAPTVQAAPENKSLFLKVLRGKSGR